MSMGLEGSTLPPLNLDIKRIATLASPLGGGGLGKGVGCLWGDLIDGFRSHSEWGCALINKVRSQLTHPPRTNSGMGRVPLLPIKGGGCRYDDFDKPLKPHYTSSAHRQRSSVT